MCTSQVTYKTRVMAKMVMTLRKKINTKMMKVKLAAKL